MSKKVSILLVVFLLILSLAIMAKTVNLTILYINDTHGHAWPFNEWHNPGIGGFAAIATLVKEIRAENRSKGVYTLFLHAGDFNTGIPESDLLNAEPDIKALNMMHLDAMCIGNHEFDHPYETLIHQILMADFPVLSANVVYKGTNMTLVPPYIIKDFDGFKVAILGLTTQSTAYIGNPKYVKDEDFLNPIVVAKRYVPMLRKKADLVIALAHLGFKLGETPNENDPYVGSVGLAEGVNGIDVIVDGHSHTALFKPFRVNKTLIVQAKCYTEYLGRLDLTIEDGKIVSYDGKLIPINLKNYAKKNGKAVYTFKYKEIKEDPEVKKMLDAYKAIGAKKLSEPLGTTEVRFSRAMLSDNARDSMLGHLVTDSLLWKFKDADVALQNTGGMRADLNPGKITYRDVLKVLPFGDTVVHMEMSGAELMKVLDYAATVPENRGAKLQAAGLTWEIKDGKPVNVMVKGQPLDPNKTYVIVVNDYMAHGGDGYTVLKNIKNQYDTGYVQADILKDYILYLKDIKSYDSKIRCKEVK